MTQWIDDTLLHLTPLQLERAADEYIRRVERRLRGDNALGMSQELAHAMALGSAVLQVGALELAWSAQRYGVDDRSHMDELHPNFLDCLRRELANE